MYEFLWYIYNSQSTPQPNAYHDVILDNRNPCRPVPDSLKESVQAYRNAVEGADGFPQYVLEPTGNLPCVELPPGSRRDYCWHYLAYVDTLMPGVEGML